MALYYFDASAIVKYYVTEPGSTWVRQIIDAQDSETGRPRHIILIAEITHVETAAGLAVIERVGRIGKTTRDRAYRRFMSQLTQRYAIIPLTSEDLETAANLTQQHPLKAYDAVQLAVALRSHRLLTGSQHTCIFVSGDAARSEGLSTDNPFDHVLSEDAPGRPV
jgi:predicted nucleic acid-binding protein